MTEQVEQGRVGKIPEERTDTPVIAEKDAANINESLESSILKLKKIGALKSGNISELEKLYKENPKLIKGDRLFLHTAIQICNNQTMEWILSRRCPFYEDINVNLQDDNGNTGLHLAALYGRQETALLLLNQPSINDTIVNSKGKQPVELAKTPQIAEVMQISKAQYVEKVALLLRKYLDEENTDALEELLSIPRASALLDINGQDPDSGSTVLHDFVRKKNRKMVEFILNHGGDPFTRDYKGVLPIELTKDDGIKKLLKAAKKEQIIIDKSGGGGGGSGGGKGVNGNGGGGGGAHSGEAAPSMKGYLKKWTNFTGGYKLRWFVLENGILSYYKRQDDTERACRGSINLKEARLHLDSSEKLRFEVIVKGSGSKFHLKGNHPVETTRWVWALQNSIQYAKDIEKLKAGSGIFGGSSDLHRSGTMSSVSSVATSTATVGGGSTGGSTGGSGGSSNLHPHINTASGNSSRKRPDSILSHSSKHSITEMFASTNSKITAGIINIDDNESGINTPISGLPKVSLLDNIEILPNEEEEDDDYSDGGLTDPESIDDRYSSQNLGRFEDSISLEANAIRDLINVIKEKNKNSETRLSPTNLDNCLSTISSSIDTMESVAKQHANQFSAQERQYQQKLESAENKERLWAKNLRDLELEHEKIQGDLYFALQKRKEVTKLLRERSIVGPIPTINTVSTPAEEQQKILTPPIAESESESESDDEFFDSLPEVTESIPSEEIKEQPTIDDTKPQPTLTSIQEKKHLLITNQNSFAGYEDGPRTRLKLDGDDRPKISLWGVLKSLIGKDMTRMALPVSFNECTNLLQRSAEDMEYTDILDRAAKITDDPGLRLAHIAAFAASSYSSTINRIAKPFNPLLGETFEYCRPDCGYRLFSEQVSHHPPIGALMAESTKWDFYGASNVKSKFNGRSFDINPLGRWYLTLRPDSGSEVEEELYSFRKVTSSVVGIITGSPVVDNYGDMDIINHTLGYKCTVNFKSRGWSGKNAYELKGTVLSPTGKEQWVVGGRWNDKIIARRIIHGEEVQGEDGEAGDHYDTGSNAVLLWKVHERPVAPFNLTSFAITLNSLPDKLKEYLAPTDTRYRPDQRAMEEGRYDEAADDKLRVEEKQRAVRKLREQSGTEYEPVWFKKSTHPVTGEEYYVVKQDYWTYRQEKKLADVSADIF